MERGAKSIAGTSQMCDTSILNDLELMSQLCRSAGKETSPANASMYRLTRNQLHRFAA